MSIHDQYMDSQHNLSKRSAIHLSAHLQHTLSQKITHVSTYDSLRSPLSEALFRKREQRSPFTGVNMSIPNLRPQSLNRVSSQFIKDSSHLSSETLAETEKLQVASSILNSNTIQPLARYKISRKHFMESGIPQPIIDRIYRSLLVYTLGFYRLIVDVLKHSDNKFSLVATIWKVFAILLEQCCHLDYEMLVTALQTDQNKELELVSEHYKEKISKLEAEQRTLAHRAEKAKLDAQGFQDDLKKQIRKRTDLEQELQLKGDGHQSEVNLRLHFQGQINSLSARVRDLESLSSDLLNSCQDQGQTIEKQCAQIIKEQRKKFELKQEIMRLNQAIDKLETHIDQTEDFRSFYEEKIRDCYERVEEAQNNVLPIQNKYDESVMIIAAKNLEIDNLGCEIKVNQQEVQKLSQKIVDQENMRQIVVKQVQELEIRLQSQINHFKALKIEKTQLGELCERQKSEISGLQEENIRINGANDSLDSKNSFLSIHLEQAEALNQVLKQELDIAVRRIEDMNKGRRFAEDQNVVLVHDNTEKGIELLEYKQKLDKLQQSSTIQAEMISDLKISIKKDTIRIESLEKQSNNSKRTLNEKIKNLSEIIASERALKAEWIEKYEQSVKLHYNVVREKEHLEDQLNSALINLNSAISANCDSKEQIDRLNKKSDDLNTQLLQIRPAYQELQRKSKTFQALTKVTDREHEQTAAELKTDIVRLQAENVLLNDRRLMLVQDVWAHGAGNYLSLEKIRGENRALDTQLFHTSKLLNETFQCLDDQKMNSENKSMFTEDLLILIAGLRGVVDEKQTQIQRINNEWEKTQNKVQKFLSMIPDQAKTEENPFDPFLQKIEELEFQISRRDEIHASMIHTLSQTENFYSEKDVQTDPEKPPKRKKQESPSKSKLIKQNPPYKPKIGKPAPTDICPEPGQSAAIKPKPLIENGPPTMTSKLQLGSMLKKEQAGPTPEMSIDFSPRRKPMPVKPNAEKQIVSNRQIESPIHFNKGLRSGQVESHLQLSSNDVEKHLKQPHSSKLTLQEPSHQESKRKKSHMIAPLSSRTLVKLNQEILRSRSDQHREQSGIYSPVIQRESERLRRSRGGVFSERLPKIAREGRMIADSPLSMADDLILKPRSRLSTDIRRHMKQAYSRRSSDLSFS